MACKKFNTTKRSVSFLIFLIILNCVVPTTSAYGPLTIWERHQVQKEKELERKKFDKPVRFMVNTISAGNTYLFCKGGYRRTNLALGMLSVKALNVADSGGYLEKRSGSYSEKTSDNYSGIKAWTSLIFAGIAFCFNSRSMELSGATILFFTHIWQL